jgi:serine protease
MPTRNKKSSDKTHKLNRGAICLKLTAALIILLTAFPGAQRVASTQGQSQNPDQMQIVLIDGREVVANEAIVRFNATDDLQRQTFVDNAISLVNASDHRRIGPDQLNMFHIRSKNMNTRELVNMLSKLAGVQYAEFNYVYHAGLTPNDTRFGQMWGLNNTGQVVSGQTGVPGADISAVQAWDVSTGSTSVVVGVIDTGVDYNHPDLAANIWSAPASFTVTVGGQTITCPAGSHGFNAVANTCNPLDDNNHGTHTSGTIGARGNNGQGVVGVNWTTRIMGLKFLNASGSGNTADAIECIQFAVQAKQRFGASANVRVLSNSWGGGGFSQALLDAINSANSNNMLFVAAAGNANSNNDTTAFFPANYNAPNVLAVAATDNRDNKSSFSNFGATTVDLGAPGTSILSTVRNGGFAVFSGTSMATPHVSGAAALVLSRCSLSTSALKANLMNNVDRISSLSGRTVSGGRLNVDRAIRACSGL